MRTVVLLAAVLLAAPCQAQIPYIANNNSMFGVPVADPAQIAPLDFTFEMRWPNAPDNWQMTYSLHGLTPADLGRVWTITADNAAEIGLDWNRLVDNVWNNWPKENFRFGANGNAIWIEPTSFIETPLGRFERSVCCHMSFEINNHFPVMNRRLDYMRIYFSNLAWHPGVGVTYVEMGTSLIGSIVIPEPSSAMLAAVALCGLLNLRHRSRPIGP